MIDFETSPELETITDKDGSQTKARQNGEKYGACVVREAKKMNEKLDGDPINQAVCDVIQCCHVISLLTAVVDCAHK